MHTKTSDEAADEASAHSIATSVSADVPTPTIRLLTVERFRGIQSLTWRPRAFFMTLWRPCSRNDGRSCGIRWG